MKMKMESTDLEKNTRKQKIRTRFQKQRIKTGYQKHKEYKGLKAKNSGKMCKNIMNSTCVQDVRNEQNQCTHV